MIEPYGLIIIVVLLATQVLNRIVGPIVAACGDLISAVFGLT
jgi:hypothetical protein